MNKSVLAQRIFLFNSYAKTKDNTLLFSNEKVLKRLNVEKDKLIAVVRDKYRRTVIDKIFDENIAKEQIESYLVE